MRKFPGLCKDYSTIDFHDPGCSTRKKPTKAIPSTTTPSSWISTGMRYFRMERRGKHLVKVGRFYPSSKLSSSCDHKHDVLQLSVREWTCPECRMHHERDENPAIIIPWEPREGILLEIVQDGSLGPLWSMKEESSHFRGG
ncbi:transposase [Candidatus Bathyarchaeota archaeon]|nr:transposase [Candidatus Bathyarchaeota archaeon]